MKKLKPKVEAERPYEPIPVLEGLSLLRRCQHKDIYDFGEKLLIVTNDKIRNPYSSKIEQVEGKGVVAARQSSFWFKQLAETCPNHCLSDDVYKLFADCRIDATNLIDRSAVVRKMLPLPMTCMVQGYLTGQAWEEYSQTGALAGVKLPPGMLMSQRLPAPVFIPIFSKTSPVFGIEQLGEFCGKHLSSKIRSIALNLFFKAWKVASQRNILLVSTVFRFGLYKERIHLIGECITPDSSVFAAPALKQNTSTLLQAGRDLLFSPVENFDHSESDCLLGGEDATGSRLRFLLSELAENGV